jgi:hypothetical protein
MSKTKTEDEDGTVSTVSRSCDLSRNLVSLIGGSRSQFMVRKYQELSSSLYELA